MQGGARHRQLLLLATALCAVNYARFAAQSMQEALAQDLRLDDNQVALLLGTTIGLPMALGSALLTSVVDRVRPRTLFTTLLAVCLMVNLFTVFAASFALIFAARLVLGTAVAVIYVAVFTKMPDLYAASERGRATMVTTIGEIAGPPVAFALGGTLLALASRAPAMHSLAPWRLASAWMCLPLGAAVPAMLAIRNELPSVVRAEDRPLKDALRALWPYRWIAVPLLLSRMMVWIADGAVLVWAAPALSRNFKLTPDRIGDIMAMALLVSGVLGPVLGGALADICQKSGGPRRTLLALCILTALGIPAAMFGIVPNVTAAAIGLTALLIVGFTGSVMAFALTTIVIPAQLRSVYVGITFSAAAVVGFGGAPLAVSTVSGLLGEPSTIGIALTLICVVTSVVGAGFFALSRRLFLASGLGRPVTLSGVFRSSRPGTLAARRSGKIYPR
jgi:predicted MFS family arabinose efflux permease